MLRPLHAFAPLGALLFTLAALPVAAAAAPAHGRLDDTGIDTCETAAGSQRHDCAGSGQDAASGRDVTAADATDGRLGFSFTKLDAAGQALPAAAGAWSCVVDRVTGLAWEMKTTDGSVHDTARRWTNLGDGTSADASALVAAANAEALCGRTDWRLPTRNELQGLVDYSKSYPGPTVDTDWLPDSDGYSFWTSTPHATAPGNHWYVNFQDGWTGTLNDAYAFGEARVVSGAAVPVAGRFVVGAGGAEVTDRATGLTWARCSVGQAWDGATCAGGATHLHFLEAVRLARQAAARTGKPWRVPNAKEAASLAIDGRADPAVDPVAFPGTPSKLYWTSSPYMGFPFYAWTFFGYDGTVTSENIAEPHLVRLVR